MAVHGRRYKVVQSLTLVTFQGHPKDLWELLPKDLLLTPPNNYGLLF